MPPRRGRTPNNNPEFLWVNRTPDSDHLSASRQERDELRTITSHARTWRAALRRQQRLVAAQTGASHAQRIVGWNRQENSSVARSDQSSSETSAAPSPAALVPFAADEVAPFAYLEGPSDAWWSQNAFQYATQSWLPSIFQNLDVFDPDGLMSDGVVRDTINAIVQGCLLNRMHMFSLLSASTCYLKFILKAQLDKVDTPEYCMGKALQYLRHYFASDPRAIVNELVIFDLMAISTFERYVGNFEGARTHFSMVQHLIESHGGLDSLNISLRLVCHEWDLLAAAATAERPLIPMTWYSDASSPTHAEEVHLELLTIGVSPSGASLNGYASSTPSILSNILTSIVEWFQEQQLLRILPSDQTTQLRVVATRRSYALVHKLLSTPAIAVTFPDQFSSITDSLDDEMLECIKQACLITISASEEARSVRAAPDHLRPVQHDDGQTFAFFNMPVLRHALTEVLQRLMGPNTHAGHHDHGLILWIACIAAQKCTQQAQGQQQQQQFEEADRDWFLGLARQFAARMQVATLSGLADVLSRYIYILNPDASPNTAGLETVLG
ncbi:hypothetical protein LTR84_002561 [Exophiala bonariae]|uniref:Transcription factor domain-containing protein n=1 Tax=Exophiala bonariae TaxID=1690606 RepID=A0AAV9NAU8_9EURO|nr:hypothetical protein LTR84_002561 [Exophiala bonariae]